MAEKLARLYGTEDDRVNCPFYFKIGACRHGDRCSRLHNKPTFSQTVCLKNMYVNPMASVVTSGGRLSREQEAAMQEGFQDFFIDVFDEVAKFGRVEELLVCDNLSDHLIGNVYIKFHNEEDAADALAALQGRWYSGRQLAAEYSPVTEFREARCRQFDEAGCNRGHFCNFLHVRHVPRDLREELVATQPAAAAGGGGDRDRDDRGSSSRRERDERGGGGRDDRYRDERGDRYRDDRYRDDRGGGRDERDRGGRDEARSGSYRDGDRSGGDYRGGGPPPPAPRGDERDYRR